MKSNLCAPKEYRRSTVANLRSRWRSELSDWLLTATSAKQQKTGQAAPVDHEPRAIPVAVPAGSAVPTLVPVVRRSLTR